jgi:hypothetical protein
VAPPRGPHGENEILPAKDGNVHDLAQRLRMVQIYCPGTDGFLCAYRQRSTMILIFI